ncbi:MAG: ribosomal L7Ae/L30e/S12e/Gadd45 family protein [Eubacteriales bacterium]|nr:ribosomal L7Ae/L30e/S12e/Gadd45 family protein [Eubacteriales bacterium]
MPNPIYLFLGIAKKAGKLEAGEELCGKMLKAGNAKLIIVATDASDNTKKKFSDMCKHRNVFFEYFGEKEALGRSLGKGDTAAICITDVGISKKLKELISDLSLKPGVFLFGNKKQDL